MNFPRLSTCTFLLVCLVSCGGARVEDNSSATPHAYAGPGTLNIRQDLNPKSATVATVKHGDRLEILDSRRRFVKVRTPAGVVGWTDNRQLLTPQQMTGLDRMAQEAGRLPSEGLASVFESLNMHPEPNRLTPGFVQLAEGTKVEVVDHKLAPRVQVAVKSEPILAPIPKPKPLRRRGRSKDHSGKIGPPPMPLAPLPPSNWLEMSRTVPDADRKPAEPSRPVEPPKPVPMDDWFLVRTKQGKAGWVLARMVSMSIPDEVAQYAEGHRIMSYFPLGKVDDDGAVKNNWLWTTMSKVGEPYEYDSFRIFVWSRRHHRYETAYIERNVVGHYPTVVNDTGENPSFTLLLDEDGKLYRKTYEFNGYRVHLISSEPYTGAPNTPPPAPAIAQNRSPADTRPSWLASIKSHVKRILGR